MDRWACVDVPALPLQLLVRREPTWRTRPAAVVDRDGPQGTLLWVNEAARRVAILPGMRFAAGLSLSRELMAGQVDAQEIAQGTEQLTQLLRNFSPDIEPCIDEPGVLWLDAGGLSTLFTSASAWARALHDALTAANFVARVAVGFTRYGSYAAAKGASASSPIAVFRTAEEESFTAHAVPLARLGLDPQLRDDLAKLGVQTLGQFLELPAPGLAERFEPAVAALHRLAAGAAWRPLEAAAPPDPLEAWLELEAPDDDITRLLFWIKQLLDPLLLRAAQRGDAAIALQLSLWLDPTGMRYETVRAAAPTRESSLWLDLLRLRLAPTAHSPTKQRVTAVSLALETALTPHTQAQLPEIAPTRPLDAANRALARVRAELGTTAVARARLRDGHLPEATFLWEPLDHLPEAMKSGPATSPLLVRRMLPKAHALPPRVHNLRDDGWIIGSSDQGPIEKLEGPYVVAGGWWARPIHREYHFAQTQRGDLLWVYYDRPRRRWYWQGEVL